MFSEMVAGLAQGALPEPALLRKRFDIALTKKMGVVRLPKAFWPDDPKINPRSDHLFWAALLTLDRHRIDLALAVLAAELNEKNQAAGGGVREGLEAATHLLIERFFDLLRDAEGCQEIRAKLERIVPEWIGPV